MHEQDWRNALARTIANKLKAEDEPSVGHYHFADLVALEVHGTMKKAEDTEVRGTAKLPILEILAMIVDEKKLSARTLFATIRKAAKLSEADKQARGLGDFLETTKAAVRTVEDELAELMPRQVKAGALTGEVAIKIRDITALGKSR